MRVKLLQVTALAASYSRYTPDSGIRAQGTATAPLRTVGHEKWHGSTKEQGMSRTMSDAKQGVRYVPEVGGTPLAGRTAVTTGAKEQRYSTAFFQSSTENFENLVENFGYAEYYPLEALDEDYIEGFERSNYFGYEDDIMLRPSKEWLRKQRAHPFMVTYFTIFGRPRPRFVGAGRQGLRWAHQASDRWVG
jgi:hypothetical protein